MGSWLKSILKKSRGADPATSEAEKNGQPPEPQSTTQDRPEEGTVRSGNQEVLENLSGWIVKRSPSGLSIEQIDPDTHLYDAGYTDSITAAEFLLYIEKSYQVRIAESELVGGLSSLTTLVDHIVRNTPDQPAAEDQ